MVKDRVDGMPSKEVKSDGNKKKEDENGITRDFWKKYKSPGTPKGLPGDPGSLSR